MSIKIYLSALIMGSLYLAATDSSVAGLENLSDWSSSDTVTLPSDNGPVQAIVRQLSFIWKRDTDQYLEHHNVIAVVIPSKNVYWLGESSDQQIFQKGTVPRQFFVLGNNIVGVSANAGDTLKFYVSANQLTTTDAPQEVKSILQQKLNELGSQKWDVKAIPFGMEKVLGFFPFTGFGSARGEPAPTITKIDVDSNGFTIEMAGGKDNAITASITFDSTFNPVAATLKGKQVFPK